MEHRRMLNERLIGWLRSRAEKYSDEISMVLIYGSHLSGTSNRLSDLDCYYIPKGEGSRMAVTYILEGVGYDVFPIGWERLERFAALQETIVPLLGDAKVIWCGDEAALTRFCGLQEQMKRKLADDDYVQRVAKERFRKGCALFGAMKAAGSSVQLRRQAGALAMVLADAVAVRHHDYFHRGMKKQYEDLAVMAPGLADRYAGLIRSADDSAFLQNARRMLEAVGELLGEEIGEIPAPAPEEPQPRTMNVEVLCSVYEEICSTFNKIYIACEERNDILAFLAAVCLQRDLDDFVAYGLPPMDLLSGWRHDDLRAFAETVKGAEGDYLRVLAENGGKLRTYDSFEEFEKAMQ